MLVTMVVNDQHDLNTMATYQRIEYRISPEGKVTEQVIDGRGAHCLETTIDLEAALGEVTARETLPDYHEGDAVIHDVTIDVTHPHTQD